MCILIIAFSVVAMIFAVSLGSSLFAILLALAIPMLASLITIKLLVTNKKIKFDEKLTLKLFLSNAVIIVVVPLFYGVEFYLIGLVLLLIAFVPVVLYSQSQFSRAMDKVEIMMLHDQQLQGSLNGYSNSINVSKEKLSSLTDEGIQSFFQSINLKYTNYFIATTMPSITQYALFGALLGANATSYIIAFSSQEIYMFELSKLSVKTIINCLTIPWSDLEMVSNNTFMRGMAYRITVRINGDQVLLQANRKFRNIMNQNICIENFLLEASVSGG